MNPLRVIQRSGRFIVLTVQKLLFMMAETIRNILVFCENWLLGSKKAKHGLSVARMAFGVAGIGILLSNWSTRLYSMGPGSMWNGEWAAPSSAFPEIWLFSTFRTVMPSATLFTLMYILLLVLAILVTVGWRFKLVLPVYFVLWVSFIESQDQLGDQGDNMYRIALLLLVFADATQVWSLDSRRRTKNTQQTSEPWVVRVWRGERIFEKNPAYSNLFNNLVLVALTAQVCFVYASGALYKAAGTPWQDGTAVYAPLQTIQFGTWPGLSELATTFGWTVAIATWGSVILQMLFPMMLLTHPTRVIALVGIMAFHLGIAVLMGLPWFSLTLIAVDFIFITEKSWNKMIFGATNLWKKSLQPVQTF